MFQENGDCLGTSWPTKLHLQAQLRQPSDGWGGNIGKAGSKWQQPVASLNLFVAKGGFRTC